METKRDRQRPLLDQEFLKRSLAPVDIEERRRWEEIYIRYFQPTVPSTVAETVIEDDSDGGDGGYCLWTLEGSDIIRYGGNVGVGIHPWNNDFEVLGNVLVEASTETPYVEIRNWSDTAYDPMLHWSVGADPQKKYTMGVDDSDSDAWMLCYGDQLTSAVIEESLTITRTYTGYIIIADYGNYRVHTYTVGGARVATSGDGAAGSGDEEYGGIIPAVCNDGTYCYICDSANDRIIKRRISDQSFVAKVGTIGTGNDEFNSPEGICTDGTYLYICDANNDRIVKRLCSDLSYVLQESTYLDWDGSGDSKDFNHPRNCATDGEYLWIVQNSGLTGRIIRSRCSNLNGVDSITNDGHIDSCTLGGLATNSGNYIYITNSNVPNTILSIYKYTKALVYVDHWLVGGSSVSGEIYQIRDIDINGDIIFVPNINGTANNPKEIQSRFLANPSALISKFGEYGTAVDKFMAINAISLTSTYALIGTYLAGPIFKAADDGAWVDSYPLHRFRKQIQLMENGVDDAVDYVGLNAPGAITASYDLTFPDAVPGAAGHFAVSALGIISWGQNVGTTGSPTFSRITVTIATGASPFVITSQTVCTNLNADMLDGFHASSFSASAHDHDSDYAGLAVQATASPTVNDDITNYLEGTVWVEQDSNTVWFCADNADGAAVWHGINQDLLTTSAVNFAGATLSDNLTVYKDGACAVSQYACGASDYAQLSLYRSRGTYASKTAVADEDYVGRIQFLAYSDNPALPYLVGVIESRVKAISGVTPYGSLNIAAGTAGAVGMYLSETQNIGLFTSTFGTDAVKVLALATGTAPSTAPADSFQMYSKDVSAGNAAPHFLLEGGEEVSLRNDGYYVDGVIVGGGGGAFLDLTDVEEADYTGHAGEFVVVNGDEDALVFTASSVAAHALTSASHTDVNAGSPDDNDVLTWDGGAGEWVAAPLPAAAPHELLSLTHNDTAASAVSRGSIIVGNSTPAWAELVVGTAGQVLTTDGIDISWGTAPVPKLDDCGAPDDNTDLNVSVALHGLVPKAPNDTTKFLRGDASWAVPVAYPSRTVVKSAEQETNNDKDAFVDITGLSFSITSGRYYKLFVHIIFQTTSATIAPRFAWSTYPTITVGAWGFNSVYAGSGATGEAQGSATSFATVLNTMQNGAANTDLHCYIWAWFLASSTETLQLSFAPESDTYTITIQAGALGILEDYGVL